MAVIEVNQIWDGRTGGATIKNERKYTLRFEVVTNNPGDGSIVVRAADELPRLGDPYITPMEQDPGALAVSIDPEQSPDDPQLWYVTVEYSSKLDFPEGQQAPGESPAKPGERPENPLSRPPVIRCGHKTTTRVLTKDKDGNPILNAAGDPFDPPLEEEVTYLTVSITVNKAAWWADQVEDLLGSVNSKKFLNMPARTWKLEGISGASKFENNASYWEVTYELIHNKDTWDVQVLNAGFNEVVVENNVKKKRRILGDTGPVTSPQLLHKDGFALPVGGEPYFMSFRVRKEVNFKGRIP